MLDKQKNHQNVFKSDFKEIKKEGLNQKSKKVQREILKCFKIYETKLSHYLIMFYNYIWG